MSFLLRLLAVLITGVLAGIYVGVAIGDVRIAQLSADQYAAMHQTRDRTFGRVMPFIGVAVVVVLAVNAIGAASRARSGEFALAGLAEVLDMLCAVRFQVPRNRAVQSWGVATPPLEWWRVRDGWAATHLFRTALGGAIFMATALAAL